MKLVFVHLFSYDPVEAISICKKYNIGYEITLNAERLDTRFNELINLVRNWPCSTHAPVLNIDLGALDPLILEAIKRRLKMVIDFSKKANSKWIVIHTGYHYIYHSTEIFCKKWLHTAKKTLFELSQTGIPIHVENLDEPTPYFFVNLFRETDEVFFCLDIGHAYSFSKEKNLLKWVDVLGPYIREVHLHENAGNADTHEPPGSGYIPYLSKILEKIENHVNNFVITLEPRDESDLILGLKWLRENGWIK